MHVAGQLEARVGRVRCVIIVVAGGDEYRDGHALQAAHKLLACLKVCTSAVEQIAAQKHKVDALRVHKSGHAGEKLTLLHAADRGLTGTQPLKGRIQMQVCGVQDSQCHHFSLIASALRHFPVSGSISNMQPSIMHGPLADS